MDAPIRGWTWQPRLGPAPCLCVSLRAQEDVGQIAAEAGVRTLVLPNLAGARSAIPDEAWPAAKHFEGEIVVAHDLMVV